MLVLILVLTACSKPVQEVAPAEEPQENYSEATVSLAEKREAVLKNLSKNADPLSLIENHSKNAPMETVYGEKTANGVPEYAYDLIYAWYNSFVTLEPPELSSLGGNAELLQELRLRIAKLRRNNIVLKTFSVEITVSGSLMDCKVSCEMEGGGSGIEHFLLWLVAYDDSGELSVEGFGSMQIGYGGVYGGLDTEFAKVSGRYPEFSGDFEKTANAGIYEIALGQSY